MTEYRMAFMAAAAETIGVLPWREAERIARICLSCTRAFVVGLGGSAANASHMASDLRKLAEVRAECPTDSAAEFSARINDDGWPECLVTWLKARSLAPEDLVLVLSVGGGSETTSVPLVRALEYARGIGATRAAIVSRDGGLCRALCSDGLLAFMRIRRDDLVTPFAESAQVLLCHYIANQVRLWRHAESDSA